MVGWGAEGAEFTDADKPGFAPFIQMKLGLDVRRVSAPAPRFASLQIPEPLLPAALRGELDRKLGAEHVLERRA